MAKVSDAIRGRSHFNGREKPGLKTRLLLCCFTITSSVIVTHCALILLGFRKSENPGIQSRKNPTYETDDFVRTGKPEANTRDDKQRGNDRVYRDTLDK